MNDIFLILIGVLGAACLWRKNKRQFERTNEFGEQRFSSYCAKVKATFIDALFHIFGLGLICSGVLLLALKHAADWFWVFVILLIAVGVEDFFFRDRRKMNHVKNISR